MDCYIIRVYRHTTGEDGRPGEIAGLLERVGGSGGGRPFSSYRAMVTALRAEVSDVADRNSHSQETVPDLHLVHAPGKMMK